MITIILYSPPLMISLLFANKLGHTAISHKTLYFFRVIHYCIVTVIIAVTLL